MIDQFVLGLTWAMWFAGLFFGLLITFWIAGFVSYEVNQFRRKRKAKHTFEEIKNASDLAQKAFDNLMKITETKTPNLHAIINDKLKDKQNE